MATKLYCPPTPDTTSPVSSWSETAAPRSVTIMVVLMNRAAAGTHAPAAKLHVLAEYAVSFELRELRAAEHRTCARGGQGAESALIEPLAGASRAQQPLDEERLVHAAAQDPGTMELEQLIDEHLGAGVQTRRERRLAAGCGEEGRGVRRAERGERGAPGGVLLMPQQQRVHQRVAHLADADLQRAAIAHQGARVDADGVIHRAERGVGRAEQVVVVARTVDEEVEATWRDQRPTGHEGHLRVRLAHHDDVALWRALTLDERQPIQRDLGRGGG